MQLILLGGAKLLKSFGQKKGVATAVQTIGQGKHKGGVAQGGSGWPIGGQNSSLSSIDHALFVLFILASSLQVCRYA